MHTRCGDVSCPPGVVGRGILDAPFDFRDPPGGAGLPGRGAAFDVKSGGKTTRACGPWTQGPMAAVSCTDRAKTGPALPPVFWVVSLQALPRPGWHASGLPCKPCKGLRCTGLARRAAAGAMPPKYRGVCGGLKTTRQGCCALHRRPKLRIVRFRASPKAHSLRWASSPHDDHSVGSPRGPQFLRPPRAAEALRSKLPPPVNYL